MRAGLTSLGAALLLLAGCAQAANDAPEVATGDAVDERGVIDKQARGDDPWSSSSWGADDEQDADEAPRAEPDEPEEPEPEGELDEVDAAPSDGRGPTIPAISGTCPIFRTGTATIGGLGGISLQVGAKQDGTGSIVFYWHGTGSSSFESNVMLPAAVRSEVLAQGGIIVAPSGSRRTGGDCSGTATFSKDDFKVMDLIYACAVKEHGIDPRRAYTTGCSAGGLQAGCMASVRSSYIAAAVPNSGGIVFPQQIQDSSHVPALMTMHGSAADMVVVSFSQTSATLDNQFARAGGYVLNCNHGGGHCGAPATLQSAGWKFMKDHPFGARPYAGAGGTPAGFPSYCRTVASAGGSATPGGSLWPF